jgi:hypothetical protein
VLGDDPAITKLQQQLGGPTADGRWALPDHPGDRGAG